MRLTGKKNLLSLLFAISLFSTFFLSTAANAITCTCVCGSGTQSDPWIIDSDAALACFDAGNSYFAGGGDAYIKQTANVTKTNNLPIYQEIQPLHYDGGGYSITIDGVSGFDGLFISSNLDPISNYEIYNLKIKVSNGSTLNNSRGWVVTNAENSTFDRIVIEAPISSSSGGIVGVGNNVTITKSYSTGDIDDYGGGILGENSVNSTVSNCYSTGVISFYAGGIVGAYSNGVTVEKSYSTGQIYIFGGGIIGANGANAVVLNSFTTGFIGDRGGGIFGNNVSITAGSNLYTSGGATASGGGILAEDYTDNPTGVTNAYAESNNSGFGFNKVNANMTLSGIGTFGGGNVWGECDLVDPTIYYLQALYSSDPCAPPGSGGGTDTSANPYEPIGKYSITCPNANPGENEKITYANKVTPVGKDGKNLIGRFINQSTLEQLGAKGIYFDYWSNKVKTATIELTNFGCFDKLISVKKNKSIQFIAGGFRIQSEARGYLQTPDGQWFDLTGVTLYQDTAAFLHTIIFTKPGNYLIVISQSPNTDAGLIPTYGFNNARFVVEVKSNKVQKTIVAKQSSKAKTYSVKVNQFQKALRPLSQSN